MNPKAPVYPTAGTREYEPSFGFTIRDYVAIEAMKTVYPAQIAQYGKEIAIKTFAEESYRLADIMIAQSNK